MRICKVQRHEDNVYQDINERLEEEEEKQAMQDYERLVEIENTAQQTGEQSATLQPVAEVDRLLFAYKLRLQQLQSTCSPVPDSAKFPSSPSLQPSLSPSSCQTIMSPAVRPGSGTV